MTELNLRADQGRAPELHVRIDLGQSLLSPRSYWQAVTASPERQAQLLEPAVDRLHSGLQIRGDGVRLPMTLTSWQLAAVSEEAISNPLTPQMATLSFELPHQNVAVYEITLTPGLDVPWPALLRVDTDQRELPVSRLLTEDQRSSREISLRANTSATKSGADAPWLVRTALAAQSWLPGLTWVAVGYQHIVPMGLDHIVFVLGLFFLSTRLSTLLWQVTCFTLAHSVTLALAMLEVISVSASLVEPLIAASIIYVGVDNLVSGRLVRWRLAVVTAFGLLHGLGFATALRGLHLSGENFLGSLMMFNLGVELGQLTVIAGAFLLVGWLQRRSWYTDRVAHPATMGIAGVGTYWLLKRLVLA